MVRDKNKIYANNNYQEKKRGEGRIINYNDNSGTSSDDTLIIATQKPAAIQCISWNPHEVNSTQTAVQSKLGIFINSSGKENKDIYIKYKRRKRKRGEGRGEENDKQK